MTNKRTKITAGAVSAAFLASAFVPAAVTAAPAEKTDQIEMPFKDVSGHYTEPVKFLLDRKITEGMTETTFGTTQSIKRGDAAVFIVRALDLNVKGAPDQGFTDLNSRVKDEVNTIARLGIASGKGEGKFEPDAPITRQEMAKMLVGAFKLEGKGGENPFEDVSKSWAKWIVPLYENKITQGKTETLFEPTKEITRGEFAIFIKRSFDILGQAPEGETTFTSQKVTKENEIEVALRHPEVALKPSDFIVTNARTGEAVSIDQVKPNETNTTYTLQLANKLESQQAYKVTLKRDKTTYIGEVKTGTLKVAKIVAPKQTVVANTWQNIDYTLLDEKGTDVTASYASGIQSHMEYKGDKVSLKDGQVKMDPNSEVELRLSYTTSKNTIYSEWFVVNSYDANIVTAMPKWTVTTTATAPNFADANFKMNNTVTKGQTSYLHIDGRNASNQAVKGAKYEFETSNPEVAVVDAHTGKITTKNAGKVDIIVKAVKETKETIEKESTDPNKEKETETITKKEVTATETINLNVLEQAKANELFVQPGTVVLSTKDTEGEEVELFLQDQYGKPLADQNVTVGVSTNVKVDQTSLTTDEKGRATVKVKPNAAKASKEKVTFTAGAVTTALAVNIETPGAFSQYKIYGLEDSFDLALDKGRTKAITVLSEDANGLTIKKENIKQVKVTIDGKERLDLYKDGVITLPETVQAGAKVEVEVQISGQTLPKRVMQVVDSTEIEFTSTEVSGTSDKTLVQLLNQITKVSYGKTVQSVQGMTTNSAIVKVNDEQDLEIVKGAKGTVDIYIERLQVQNKGTSEDYTLPQSQKITVTIR